MKRPIRVAALIDSFDVSGPGRQLAALVPRLEDQGVEMRLILFHRRGDPSAPFERFIEAKGIPYEVVTDAMRFDPRIVQDVNRCLRAWAPDIIETHNYRCGAVAFALRKLGARWPWAGFFHGLTAEDWKVHLYHWCDRRLLRHADRIVVISQTQRALFDACAEKVLQIPNAALPGGGDGRVPDEIAQLLAGTEHPCFAVVARLSHEKGVDLFLEALRLLRERGLSFSAVIAGDGPERERLSALAASLDLSDTVHFLGTVNPIDPVYGCADVVVLPSRSEGLPNVLLEGLRAQCAVVATRVGAVPEVVTNPLAAHVVEPGSPEALAEAMLKACASPLSEDAIDAQRAILNRFGVEQRVDAHLRLYRSLLEPPIPA